jgi:aminoglycoside/choline kinase family phosphotransferase
MTSPHVQRVLATLYGDPAPEAELVRLRGDASTRSYFRAHIEGGAPHLPANLIVMKLPEDALRSDEGGEQPASERLPFLEVAALLASRGLPVPKIYAEDLEHGVILLEDLGDLTLHEQLSRAGAADRTELYGRAVDLLARLHTACEHLPKESIVARRRFDRSLLDWELEHFRQWGLEALFGKLGPGPTAVLDRAFTAIADRIEAMPYGFVHRDYQSKNLMVRPDGTLALIDFQDALIGPRVYDLVALLCDSYVALDIGLQESMIDRYAALRRIEPGVLHEEFWWVTLHRKLKDAGRFIFIDRVRKNPDFLRWFPQSLIYVGRALRRSEGMEPLGELLGQVIPGFPGAVQEPASAME